MCVETFDQRLNKASEDFWISLYFQMHYHSKKSRLIAYLNWQYWKEQKPLAAGKTGKYIENLMYIFSVKLSAMLSIQYTICIVNGESHAQTLMWAFKCKELI